MREAVIVLTADDVDRVLGLADCTEAVEAAFRRRGVGAVAAPGVLGVHVPGGGFHIKAASLGGGSRYFAAKVNGNFPANPQRFGLPSIQGVLVLCDDERGTPLAIMDSIRVTELRTAAATGVATRHLARRDAASVTLVGCGGQAETQLSAVAQERTLRRAWVHDLDVERARTFADRMRARLGVPVDVAADLRAALAQSDVCVTCTPSRSPLLHRGDVRPGAFIAAVGADHPEKHEIGADLMASAKIVVDSLAQAAQIGDLHHAIEAGRVRPADVHAELGQIVAGARPGRESDDEIIVFDSTGTALQDVAAAALVYERALSAGLGLRVNLAGSR